MKRCNTCKEQKDTTDFYKDSHKPDGLTTTCKECRKKAPSKTRGTLEYFKVQSWQDIHRRTVNGMNANPDYHKNEPYFRKGIRVDMSKSEFYGFCDANEENIIKLYAQGETPSVDRIDASKDYSLDNIQIMSLKDNIRKSNYKE